MKRVGLSLTPSHVFTTSSNELNKCKQDMGNSGRVRPTGNK